jgi:cyanophycin synthetase
MAVLNAADPASRPWRSTVPARSPSLPRTRSTRCMATHRAQGKRVVYVEDGDSSRRRPAVRRLPLARVPLTRGGKSASRSRTHGRGGRSLGVGVTGKRSRTGLASFVSDLHGAPGRFNVFDYRGATVIADYGHNPDAISGPGGRRSATCRQNAFSVVISGAGDRRDEDIREQTRILGAAFDERHPLPGCSASAAARTARCWPCCARAGRRHAHPPRGRNPRRVQGHRGAGLRGCA